MSDITDYRIGNDSHLLWPFAQREKNIFGQEITPPHYQFFSQKLVHFGMVLHCTGVNLIAALYCCWSSVVLVGSHDSGLLVPFSTLIC